jgi:hypothetical protein
MPTTDQTIDSFLTLFDGHNTDGLMNNVFCPDSADHKTPSVGLTHDGPQFVGADKVKVLFIQLFASFPDISLTPLTQNDYRLYSKTGPIRIGFQARIKATHDLPWFPRGHDYFSPPISEIAPDKVHLTHLPACTVFTFNANALVTNWTIYFDRYRMAQQLTPGFPTSTSLANSLAALAHSLASLGEGRRPR